MGEASRLRLEVFRKVSELLDLAKMLLLSGAIGKPANPMGDLIQGLASLKSQKKEQG